MSKPTNRISTGIVVLLLAGLAGTAGLAYYVVASTPAEHDEIRRSLPKASDHKTLETKPTVEQVIVYIPSSSGLDVRFSPKAETLPSGADPKVYALNAYLREVPAVPSDAKVVSVAVDNGTATVDCNQALDAGYGSMDEKVILDGFCATLGQFSDIDKVVIHIGGKPIDSLGHADLTTPLDVIRVQPVP